MKSKLQSLIQDFLSSRFRLWIVIIVTLLIGVTTVWPIADDYKAARVRRGLLTSALQATLEDIQGLDRFSEVHVDRLVKLGDLDAKTIGEEELQSFRDGIIETARDTACSVRSIRVGQPASRPWKDGDPIVAAVATPKAMSREFNLTTLPMHLSIAGDMNGLKVLLERLHDGQKLMQTKSFQLKPAGLGEPEQLILEMDLLLFDLTEAKKEAA